MKSYLFKMDYNSFLKTIRQKSLLEQLKYKSLEEKEQRPENDLQAATERLKKIFETLPTHCQEVLRLKMLGFI